MSAKIVNFILPPQGRVRTPGIDGAAGSSGARIAWQQAPPCLQISAETARIALERADGRVREWLAFAMSLHRLDCHDLLTDGLAGGGRRCRNLT